MAMGRSDEDRALETLFAAARTAEPQPSAALFDRMESDALRVARERSESARASERRVLGILRGISEVLGGRGAVAGLLTATLAGVWLGFSPPQGLSALTQSVTQIMLGTSTGTSVEGLELIPNIDTVLSQG